MAPSDTVEYRLRESCERRVERLLLPHRFSTRELSAAIAELRGKSIVMKPISMLGAVDAPCGIRIETPQADLLFYEEGTSAHHQRHIVAHELSHVYCDHPGNLEIDAATARTIGMNPTLALRMWSRTAYSTAEEREAETMASVIRQRIYRERVSPPRRPGTATERWEVLFAQPVGKSQ